LANYTKPFKDLTNTTPLGRVARPQELSTYIKNLINTSHVDFHETEAFEVGEVVLDDVRNFGAVRGTFIDDPEQSMVGDLVLPLMPNIMHIPVIGEHVVVIEYNEQLYYTGIINRNNSPNTNDRLGTAGSIKPNTKYGNTFNKNPKVRRLAANEGDITIEGRFGNSIRLGSNQKSGSMNGAANVKIRAGQATQYDTIDVLAKENIDKDASSIYLSTDESVSIFNPTFNYGQRVDGKSIVINSDKLFLNGRNGDINVRASKTLYLEGDEVFINAKKVGTIKMGDPRAPMVPTVNGQKMLEFQASILGILGGIQSILVSAGSQLWPKVGTDAKKLFDDISTATDSIVNLSFLNFQVMTAIPEFKVPDIPPIPPLPDLEAELVKKKTGIKIKKIPSLDNLKT